MRVIARRTLREFVDSRIGSRDHAALKGAMDAWFAEASRMRWKSAADIKRLYATESVINSERVVFNIKGNAYRLVTSIDFDREIVWIKWVGSHAAYDRIDVSRISHDR